MGNGFPGPIFAGTKMNIARRTIQFVAAQLLLCSALLAQMGASLVPPADADCHAVRSGSWQDAATWDGAIPQAGERIYIPAGITVTNHATTADVEWIHVAGTLRCCDHCDTTINVHTLYVPMGGAVRLHSTGKCVVEWLPGPFLPGDTTKLSRGQICHGEFMASGVEKTAWGEVLNEQLLVGATSLKVASAKGWQSGDRLIICGTDSLVGEQQVRYQSEYVTIESVLQASDGAAVTFSPPLQYRHFRWRADLPFHVGNLTRNVVFRSRDTSTYDNRGHLMFMSSMCDMRYVTVEGCGRTDGSQPVTDPRMDVYGELIPGSDANVRARYAVHWHRIGQLSKPAVCVGCVVDGSPKWGFLIHNSVAHVKDCVAVNCYGSGFATEEGQERGSIDHCLSAMNHGMGDVVHSTDDDHGRKTIGDWGIDGSGFWLEGGGVSLTNSVACDNSGRGIGLRCRSLNGWPNFGAGNPVEEWLRYPITVDGTLLPLAYSGAESVPSSAVPIQVCRGNVCYGNKVGLQAWSGPVLDDSGNQIWPLSVRGSITDLTLWGRGSKLHLEYMRQVNVTGLKIVGDLGFRPRWNSICKISEAVLLRGPEVTVRDWSIEGFEGVAAKFNIEGENDPGGIAAKNIVIEGATVNPDGSVP